MTQLEFLCLKEPIASWPSICRLPREPAWEGGRRRNKVMLVWQPNNFGEGVIRLCLQVDCPRSLLQPVSKSLYPSAMLVTLAANYNGKSRALFLQTGTNIDGNMHFSAGGYRLEVLLLLAARQITPRSNCFRKSIPVLEYGFPYQSTGSRTLG